MGLLIQATDNLGGCNLAALEDQFRGGGRLGFAVLQIQIRVDLVQIVLGGFALVAEGVVFGVLLFVLVVIQTVLQERRKLNLRFGFFFGFNEVVNISNTF